MPVFAFLLVEGFQHTSSFKRYLLTMLGFAVVSEIPYDLAMSGSLWSLNSQNSLFTLSICLIMLYGLRLYSGRKGAAVRVTRDSSSWRRCCGVECWGALSACAQCF